MNVLIPQMEEIFENYYLILGFNYNLRDLHASFEGIRTKSYIYAFSCKKEKLPHNFQRVLFFFKKKASTILTYYFKG